MGKEQNIWTKQNAHFFTLIFGFSLTNKHSSTVIKAVINKKKNRITSYGSSCNSIFLRWLWCLAVSKQEKKIVIVTHTYNVSGLSYWCVSLTGEKPPTLSRGWDEASFPHATARISAQTKLLITREHTSRKLLLLKRQGTCKGLAALSLKCWTQQALLENMTEAWSFSGKQPRTNGTLGIHINHCMVAFVSNTTS